MKLFSEKKLLHIIHAIYLIYSAMSRFVAPAKIINV